jgi:hypothetical protein
MGASTNPGEMLWGPIINMNHAYQAGLIIILILDQAGKVQAAIVVLCCKLSR